jgi:hypothetical protein
MVGGIEMRIDAGRVVTLTWCLVLSIITEIWFYHQLILPLDNFYDRLLGLFIGSSAIFIAPAAMAIVVFNSIDLEEEDF